MRTQFPLALSIGFLLLANGLITLRHVNAQQTGSRTGASPETPTQGQSAATRIASEARSAGIELRGDTSYLPVVEGDFDAVLKKMSAAKPEVMKRQTALLEQRYDLANQPAPGVTMSRGQSGTGRRAREAPVRRDLGSAGRDDSRRDPRQEVVPRGIPAAAAPEPSRRRDALPEVPHRRDQEAERPRPHALRSRFRPARPLSCRSSRRRSSSPPGRISATSRRASSSPSTTSTSCSTAS